MRRLFAALLLIVVGSTSIPAPARADDRAEGLARELSNLEEAIARLATEYANPLAIVRKFPFQKRLIDARVFHALGNFESAAIILIDVLEDPGFFGNLEHEAAELLLGQCLLEIGNLNAARKHFENVARGREAKLAEEARFYLIELALSDGSGQRLAQLVQDLGGAVSSDRTRYGLGKAHLQLGDVEAAARWLGEIGVESEFHGRARFYLAAAYTAQKQYQVALMLLRDLTTPASEAAWGAELRDLAWLGVARLQVELGDVPTALTSYQNIGRYSPHYEVALYEMAWAYISAKQYDKALLTVDILLLTVSDETIDVDAHVLKGQLNMMRHAYDDAVESFSAIIDRFAPVRTELSQFARDSANVQRYFEWLLERQRGQARLTAPLSEKATKWVEATESIARVAAVFDLISGERADIAEAREIGQDLERILQSRSRVEIFPQLRDGWTRALALENRLLVVSSRALDAQARLIAGRLAAADAREHEQLSTRRRALDDKLRRLPMSLDAYGERQAKTNQQYMALQRKHFIVEQQLGQVEEQLLAIERYLNDKQFAASGDKLSPEREARIRADLEEEKTQLKALFDELTNLARTIAIAARRVGTGDSDTQGDENLKDAVRTAHDRESTFYDRVGPRLGGDIERGVRDLGDVRGRVLAGLSRLDAVVAGIDDEVGLKAAELRGQVAREMGSLSTYSNEAAGYESTGRALATELGQALFASALQRMDDVVLDADVGILDVVWAQKERASELMREVSDQRATKLRRLRDDLSALQEGAEPEPGEPPPAAEPAGGDGEATEGGEGASSEDGDDSEADGDDDAPASDAPTPEAVPAAAESDEDAAKKIPTRAPSPDAPPAEPADDGDTP